MRYDRWVILALLVLLACLLLPALARAEAVCMSMESAKRLVVELERCRVIEEQTVILRGYSQELEKQITLLQEVVRLKDEQIKQAQDLAARQDQLMGYQTRACEEKVKAAKPSLLEGLLRILGGVAVGILFGVFL